MWDYNLRRNSTAYAQCTTVRVIQKKVEEIQISTTRRVGEWVSEWGHTNRSATETFAGRSRKHRFLSRPDQSWTPMMPKIKNTKKHRSRTLPSIGSVSSNRVTRIRKPATNKTSFVWFIWKLHQSRHTYLWKYLFTITGRYEFKKNIHNNPTTEYIDAVLIHASRGYQCLNNKSQTQWLSDTTQISGRVTWFCCQNGVHKNLDSNLLVRFNIRTLDKSNAK